MSDITGKFLKVKCKKCNNEQNIYNKAAGDVKCLVCQETLARNTGGNSEIMTTVLRVLN
ncbi:MAG: 30S ribosomal protein S27e [Candidatus Aenigmarchaeota archaeon]|nr:30S ribosomal protein S27e [Candidatus Aenigmarchaeota archaeon]